MSLKTIQRSRGILAEAFLLLQYRNKKSASDKSDALKYIVYATML
jgi:hypothetical protein